MLLMPGLDPAPMVQQLRDEPVNIFVAEGIPGEVGRARVEAMRLGTAPWVSWVDPDDRIEPGVYSHLLDAATPEADLVHAWEREHMLNGQSRVREQVHHAFLVRRPVMEGLYGAIAEAYPEWTPLTTLNDKVVVPWVGYHWIRRPGSASMMVRRRWA